MNAMLFFLMLYVAVLTIVAIYAKRQVKGFADFVIAGGRQKSIWISLSTLASIVGGSATFGIMTLAAKHGFPAFWWLGAGSIFLVLQSLLVSEKARSLNVYTLPELAGKTVGREPRFLIALIIVISWIGIIAAQFSALESLFIPFIPEGWRPAVLFFVSVAVIVYTTAGGQISVLRTDAMQFLLLMGGVLLACLLLWQNECPLPHIEFFNNTFSSSQFATFLLVTGLPYFLGPDLLSRNFSARDGRTARRSALIAAVMLILFAVPMTLIGVWAKEHGIAENPLPGIILGHLPPAAGALLFLGLVSALISSADTCLLSVSSIIENDLIGGKNIRRMRLMVVFVGALALFIAFFQKDVTRLLLSAYAVYVPGVVFPLFACLWFAGRMVPNKSFILLGMLAGSILGIASVCMGSPAYSLTGIGLSAAASLIACLTGKTKAKTTPP
ncbi:MAG: sodium:solute symporter family protein [Deltaproteobacteria bacterium]|nr:sodium:solute symporter family protein [Deltaproteobacteria bacterium]